MEFPSETIYYKIEQLTIKLWLAFVLWFKLATATIAASYSASAVWGEWKGKKGKTCVLALQTELGLCSDCTTWMEEIELWLASSQTLYKCNNIVTSACSPWLYHSSLDESREYFFTAMTHHSFCTTRLQVMISFWMSQSSYFIIEACSGHELMLEEFIWLVHN